TEQQAKLDQIRLELAELENKIGLESENPLATGERNVHKDSLKDIEERLSGTEVLLSFCLGKSKSFLWTVTGDRVNLYQLPRQDEIGKDAQAFAGQIQSGEKSGAAGQALANELFGQLGPDVVRKRDWLLAAEGVLLNGIPLCALPGANHTFRFLPSELLIAYPKVASSQRRFVGIGDPIYNLADSRRTGSPAPLETGATARSLPVARLVGSDEELRSAAKASGLPETQLLLGAGASAAKLRIALLKTPAILHFAVHVVSPEGRPEEAALVLSLMKDNLPELLTPEAIATLRVPGTLVILSGCSSGTGKALPSSGLIGLSRAWLLAGASAVIVSAWPTPDDSGSFFSAFYSHFHALKSGSPAQRAAISLQQAQLEMQRDGGYRSASSFWAAYSIVSKE
ncbi:MAG: CHAT domain-containing protein, partial [Bryobacteraceae bacterium]